MRTTLIMPLALLTLAAACGGGSDTAEGAADARAAAEARGEEDPSLPTERTELRPTSWSGESAVEGLAWISTSTDREDKGISLVAELRGLGTDESYAWALHRGACSEPDDRALWLGYGAVADADASAPGDVAERRAGLGDAALTFTPAADGTAAKTVYVPVDGEVSVEALRTQPHSLRVHPNVRGDDPGPSVACAPLPLPGHGGSAAGERR